MNDPQLFENSTDMAYRACVNAMIKSHRWSPSGSRRILDSSSPVSLIDL